MGIVIRQGFLTSIVSYIGIALGYINLLYLYPKFLELEQLGLLRTIQDAGILLAPFAQAGLSQTIIRFFPQFAPDKSKGVGFINLTLVLSLVGFSIFTVVLYLVKDSILSIFGENAPLLERYLYLIWWLTFTLMVTALMESFSRAVMKVVFPNFVREVGIRLMQGVLVTFYFLDFISFPQFLFYSVLIYLIGLIILMGYLIQSGDFKIQFSVIKITTIQLKSMLKFSVLSLLGTGAVTLILKLDSLMVTILSSDTFRANAIYTTAFYMATVIEVPKRAIAQTNTTLISRAFQLNALNDISILYSKTSINQLIIGSLLFIGIVINLDNLYQLIPKGDLYKEGYIVVVVIGLAKLIDMVFGPNTEILVMSKYYPLHIITLLLMGVTVISLNYLLIPIWGINGAAYGTCVAYLIYNLSKCAILFWKYRIQPFSFNTIKVIFIVIAVLSLNLLLPRFEHAFIDVLIRSTCVSLVFVGLVLSLKCSQEINNILRKVFSKLR